MMELRRASHVHFIRLIKGESVTKVLNVGRGLLPLKFKTLSDICQIEDIELVPTVIRPKFECEDLSIDSTRVNYESTSLLAGEKRVMYEHENSESDSSDDDSLLDSMTLTQMKERFKVKKRKCSSKDSPGKEIKFYSNVMEEDCELMESLSSLKSKISKNRKFKRKFRISSSLSSSQTALSVVKTEVIPIDEAISQSSGSSPSPASIKIEIPDPIESSWDNVLPIATESSCRDFVSTSLSTSAEEPDPVDANSESVLSVVPSEGPDRRSDCGFEAAGSAFCDEHAICIVNEEGSAYREQHSNDFILYERASDEISSEDPQTANVCDLGSHVSTSVSNELKLSIVTEESNDMELHNCKSNADELAFEEEMIVDEAPIKDSKTANAHGLNHQVSSILSNEFQVCVVNKETYEYREYSDPKSVHAAKDSDGELMVHMAEEIGNQMPDLSLSGSKEDDTFVDPHPSENYAETISSSEGHISDTYNNSQSSTSSLEKLCETDITISNSIHSIELANRDYSPLSEKGAKDDESHLDVSVATQPVGNCSLFDTNLQSSIADSAVSAINYSPANEEKQSVESANSKLEAKVSSSELQSRIDEPVAEEQKHPPERLLSTRKAISPTSQKRLCEAMEFTKLDDEQYYKHTRKLCYQKLAENKISRPEKVSPIKKCETAAGSTRISQKARTENNVVLNKGILKDPNIPRSVPRFSTGCMSLESCSESAILFSQQQMRDVQSVANKLSRELKSLKDIVEETLRPNVNPAAPLKYSTEEVGIAIHNATRVEENAKRLLSIMARDCNRFCKIMKLTDKSPATSGNVACKEKRKIVFADEAGGQLCDVKTFKLDLASPVDSNELEMGKSQDELILEKSS